jgi:SAM-dependent methyltransferase
MSPRVHSDGLGSPYSGGKTLEALSQTERLNQWLFSKLADGVRGDVLEIGSGIGTLSRLILPAADSLVLSDREPGCLDLLRKSYGGNAKVIVAEYDLNGSPPREIASRRFDTIVAVNVIEHVEDDVTLVAHLADLLRPGGKLLVYVPACPFAYGTIDVTLGHYRRYTPATLSALFRQSGLTSEEPRYFNLVGLFGWLVNGRALRRRQLGARQIALFESLVPLVRLEDRFRLPIGLGVYAHAVKTANGA